MLGCRAIALPSIEQIVVDSRTKFYKVLKKKKTGNFFVWRQAFNVLQVSFFRSEGENVFPCNFIQIVNLYNISL